MFLKVLVMFAVGFALYGCGGGASGISCGDGTDERADECIAVVVDAGGGPDILRCGAGTRRHGDECVALPPQLAPEAGPPPGPDFRTACVGTTNRIYAVGETGAPIVGLNGLDIKGGVGWRSRVQRVREDLPSFVEISAGNSWTAYLSTDSLGTPLAVGVYEMAQRASFTDPGRPGLDLAGAGRGCGAVVGRFEILESKLEPGTPSTARVVSLTYMFEFSCGGPKLVRGCAHYQQ